MRLHTRRTLWTLGLLLSVSLLGLTGWGVKAINRSFQAGAAQPALLGSITPQLNRTWRKLTARSTAHPATSAPLFAPITVNDTGTAIANDGKCTLPEAIIAANTDTPSGAAPGECAAGTAGSDTISLPTNATITLTTAHNNFYGPNGLPPISSAIIIEGNGASIERSSAGGTPNFRFFYVSGGAPDTYNSAGSLELRNVTLRNGREQGGTGGNSAAGAGGGGGGAGLGGAIFNRGTLKVINSTLRDNTAQGGTGGNRTAPGSNGGGGGGGLSGNGGTSSSSAGGGGGGMAGNGGNTNNLGGGGGGGISGAGANTTNSAGGGGGGFVGNGGTAGGTGGGGGGGRVGNGGTASNSGGGGGGGVGGNGGNATNVGGGGGGGLAGSGGAASNAAGGGGGGQGGNGGLSNGTGGGGGGGTVNPGNPNTGSNGGAGGTLGGGTGGNQNSGGQAGTAAGGGGGGGGAGGIGGAGNTNGGGGGGGQNQAGGAGGLNGGGGGGAGGPGGAAGPGGGGGGGGQNQAGGAGGADGGGGGGGGGGVGGAAGTGGGGGGGGQNQTGGSAIISFGGGGGGAGSGGVGAAGGIGGGGGGGGQNQAGGATGFGGGGGGAGSGGVGGASTFGGGGGGSGQNQATGGTAGFGGGNGGLGGAGSGGGGGGGGLGGAIFNDGGTLEIRNSTISGNSAIGGSGGTGGLPAEGGAAGQGLGGGVFTRNGTNTINNVTFNNNTVTQGSGTAPTSAPTPAGGGLYAYRDTGTPTLTLTNTILSNTPSGTDCFLNSTANITTTGSTKNLIESNGTSTNACPGALAMNPDPALGGLMDTPPGNTETHAITNTSPAYNAGDNATCESTDQRGVMRPQSGTCDIGAFELATPVADLSITKNDGVSSVNAGGSTTYTIVVSNAGPASADNAVFTDPAVAGLNVTGVTCGSALNGAACPTVGNTTVALMQGVGIVIPTLPSTGSVTFTVMATVTATSGSVTNTANIAPPVGTSDPTPPNNNSASDMDTVIPVAELSITKNDSVSSVNAGGTTTYTVVISNVGPSAANNAVFTDPAATGLNVTSVTCGSASGGAACPTVGNTTVALMQGAGIVIPTLPSGGSVTFTIGATVTATSGSVTNTANVAPPAGTTDPTTPNTASDTDTVNPIAELSITKNDSVSSVNAGGTTTYTVVISNVGPSAANNAVFTDPAATGLNVTSVTCGSASGGAACPTVGNTTVALMQGAGIVIPTLPSGGSVTFTIGATVTATSGSVTNTANVAPPGGTTDPTTPNTASDTDTVTPVADLSVTKNDGSATYAAGVNTIYTIVVSNAGPSPATGAVVTDNKPAQVSQWTWVCSGATNGATGCDGVTNSAAIFTDTINLPAGSSITYTVTAAISAAATGNLVNTVMVAAPGGTTDLTLSNNSATDTDTLTVAVPGVLTGSFSDPLVCTGPGNVVTGTLQLTNPTVAQQAFMLNTTLTNLLVLPGSCTVTGGVGASCTIAPGGLSLSASGNIPANGAVTVQYQAQVANVATGTVLTASSTATMGGSPATPNPLVVTLTVSCPSVGPGAIFPDTGEVSDQKAGSVLVYNLYSSSISAPNQQNTRISITNTNPGLPIAVHLFFVDGATCSIADSLVCLTPNQTSTFLASDIDPGTTGYIVAVASSLVTGCPVDFNYLIGDEYVKLSSGHAANLAAESFAAIAGGLPACNSLSVTALLSFDGASYNRAPRVLAASNIPSRADGNDTLIVLNRFGGSLAAGASTLGSIFGILYDDAENPLSFTFTAGVCQFRSSLSSSFPRVAPRFEQFIPAGRSGWAKFFSQSDIALLGAQLNFNPNAGTAANAFNQGHNLHKLTLTSAATLTIPIFPPNC